MIRKDDINNDQTKQLIISSLHRDLELNSRRIIVAPVSAVPTYLMGFLICTLLPFALGNIVIFNNSFHKFLLFRSEAMPREAEISLNERAFILQALKEGIRLDGRAFDAFRDVELTFGEEYGAVDVCLGKTRWVSCEHLQRWRYFY